MMIVCTIDAITGEREWKYRTGDTITSSPAVYSGKVYIGSWDGCMYALDAATGEKEWKYKIMGSRIYSTPVISGETVYTFSSDECMYALDATTGKWKWKYKIGCLAIAYDLRHYETSPAVSENAIYINTEFGYVCALSPYDTSTLAAKLVAAIAQNFRSFVIGATSLGYIFIFIVTYFIRRNYKSKLKDRTRFLMGIFAHTIIFYLFAGHLPPHVLTALTGGLLFGDLLLITIECGVFVGLWMWVFIELKSKYWQVFVGYLLIICSDVLMQCAIMQIFPDPFLRSELMGAAAGFLLFLIMISFLLIAILMGLYLNEIRFIKKVCKYLKYLYKEKVIWGTNTKKHEEKRRENPKRNEKKRETHKKSAGSVKDDTRPHYYKVLDVSTDASRDEIKKAYRRLSMLYHPDTSTDPDAEKKMKEINKAHDVLSDPDKRARYDNFENAFKG
jgi:hypothetical protein